MDRDIPFARSIGITRSPGWLIEVIRWKQKSFWYTRRNWNHKYCPILTRYCPLPTCHLSGNCSWCTMVSNLSGLIFPTETLWYVINGDYQLIPYSLHPALPWVHSRTPHSNLGESIGACWACHVPRGFEPRLVRALHDSSLPSELREAVWKCV